MRFLPVLGRWAAAILLIGGLATASAKAQSALCPTSVAGQQGIAFQASTCTNSVTGAYSNAALASQSLGELSQSSTEQATGTAMASVSERRAAEQRTCPAGTTRLGGECVPSVAYPFAESPPDEIAMAMPSSLLSLAPSEALAAAQPLAQDPPHWAVWTQGYGDYQRQSGQRPGVGEFSALTLGGNASTWTDGVLGGIDYTLRNLASAGDGLIGGILIGYESSHVSVRTSSLSFDPTTPSGYSTYNAQLSGPATGLYASYFNRGFSADLAFKAVFYSLDLSFADLLGFKSNPNYGFPPTTAPYFGWGSTHLTDYTLAGNINYRVPIGPDTWVEPTAGFEYIASRYASGANQFGLANDSLVRLQGGARFSYGGDWNGLRWSAVATGLLYDDALVSGGVLPSAPNPRILTDQGLLRGEGVLTLHLDHGHGVTSFLQADVEGGKGLFGAGGKVGVRVAW